jgi:uncharacterized membrane protein HdeD (DUF308 family)
MANISSWIYLYIILALLNVSLMLTAILYGTYSDSIVWMLYVFGTLLTLIGIYVSYIGAQSGNMMWAYVITIISNIVLYACFIYAQSKNSFSNNTLIGVGFHFYEIISIILSLVALYLCTGITNINENTTLETDTDEE